MKNFFKSSASIGLTVAISSIVVAGIVYAGNLTAPSGTATSTAYTLSDIYARLTKNVATTTTGNHSLSTTTSPASSFYTLTQIYNAIPTIIAGTVATGTNYLGVTGTLYGDTNPAKVLNTATYPGTATAGYTYPSKPLQTYGSSDDCYDINGDVISCAGTGEDGMYDAGQTRSYTDNGDGTITDNDTGLMWEKCTYGQSGTNCGTGSTAGLDFAQALSTCMSLSLAGHSDWRLPNRFELESILLLSDTLPMINTTYFPNTPTNGVGVIYWSSSIDTSSAQSAWNVNFEFGATQGSLEFILPTYSVRCVRNLP